MPPRSTRKQSKRSGPAAGRSMRAQQSEESASEWEPQSDEQEQSSSSSSSGDEEERQPQTTTAAAAAAAAAKPKRRRNCKPRKALEDCSPRQQLRRRKAAAAAAAQPVLGYYGLQQLQQRQQRQTDMPRPLQPSSSLAAVTAAAAMATAAGSAAAAGSARRTATAAAAAAAAAKPPTPSQQRQRATATAQAKRRRSSESSSWSASSSSSAAAAAAAQPGTGAFKRQRLIFDGDLESDDDVDLTNSSAAAAAAAAAAANGFNDASERREAVERDFRDFMAKQPMRPFLAAGMQVIVETNLSSFDSVIIEVALDQREQLNHVVSFTHPSRFGAMINHPNGTSLDERVQSITIVSPFWSRTMEPRVIRPLKDKSIILVPGYFEPQLMPTDRKERTTSLIAVSGKWPARERPVDPLLIFEDKAYTDEISLQPVASIGVRFTAVPYAAATKWESPIRQRMCAVTGLLILPREQQQQQQQTTTTTQMPMLPMMPMLPAPPLQLPPTALSLMPAPAPATQPLTPPRAQEQKHEPAPPALPMPFDPSSFMMVSPQPVPSPPPDSPTWLPLDSPPPPLPTITDAAVEMEIDEEKQQQQQMQPGPGATHEEKQQQQQPDPDATDSDRDTDELDMLCRALARRNTAVRLSEETWLKCFSRGQLDSKQLETLRGTDWGLQSCATGPNNKCWYFAMQVVHLVDRLTIEKALAETVRHKGNNAQVKQAVYMALTGGDKISRNEGRQQLSNKMIQEFIEHIRKPGAPECKTGATFTPTTYAGSNEATVLANCSGLKEKMPESFHDVQVWSINWTHGGALRHGLENKKATKSAYIALLNGNHWGVLYNKKGFDIVFEGSSQQQADDVARAVGKQFKGSPLTESQQLEVRQISSEEAKAEREAKAKSKAQSEADSERKEQPQGEAKGEADSERKEQAQSEAKSEADSERKEQAQSEAKGEAKGEADSERKEQAQQIEHPPPDTANDTSEDHTQCGDPVLLVFFSDKKSIALGCEKCMRTWATGLNTRAQQWAAKMEFEINDGEQQWMKEAGNRDRVHMAQIKEAVGQIQMMDEKSLARDFKWERAEKTMAYGPDTVPEHLWIYTAKFGDY